MVETLEDKLARANARVAKYLEAIRSGKLSPQSAALHLDALRSARAIVVLRKKAIAWRDAGQPLQQFLEKRAAGKDRA